MRGDFPFANDSSCPVLLRRLLQFRPGAAIQKRESSLPTHSRLWRKLGAATDHIPLSVGIRTILLENSVSADG